LKANERHAAVAAVMVLCFAMASSAFAGALSNLPGSPVPLIVAGAPPDSPAARVDPNLPTSPYSGVVSINIRYSGLSFICSGTLVSKRDVITAGHCIDTDGNGTVIDVSKPFAVSGNDVRVVFNSQPTPGDPGRAIITAASVAMNPFYQGFGNCPYPTTTDFCLNDDVAVIHMGQDAPDTAKIYRVYNGPEIDTGQLDTMVGYGLSGDGINGYTVGPDFRTKRVGGNVMDLFDLDDEQHFASGPKEVWYSDFDGNGHDLFCDLFGVCTAILPNNIETMLGGGDSGGPSFMDHFGELALIGNNTFGSNFGEDGPVPGAFGNYFGGMLLGSYIPWLESVTGGAIGLVPEPSTYTLILLGLVLMGVAGRQRKLS